MTLHRIPSLFVLLLVVLTGPVSLAEETPAAAVVERLHAALLDAMQRADTLGYRGRAELLAPVVASSFDFPTIARIVTGRAWRDLDEARQREFIDVFRALSVATYATNFSGYDGERFVTGDSEPARGAMIVRTELVKADGEAIPLHYMLRKGDGGWRIVNVVAKGVSDLSLKRAEYAAVIEAEGFDSLVKRLREKVAEMDAPR